MLPEVIQNKIWNRYDATSKVDTLKKQGKKIVFTNGVFDILHAGHVSYLADTKALGDILIVGVNSDDSVRRLGKSPARPLQSELSRSAVIASLQWVDAAIVFDEDTPLELISELVPDVLVKGSDYNQTNIAGAEIVLQHGGTVTTINLLPGYSTTAIEKKILSENRE
ncbi:MAG: D-glycero-beta-D-manno-heptose 1-phosphate adenylyltransferase [Bacteroidetes bacterium]|nr:D-glycero-beta-D-manno-heptose 1-phosphate adenylyltransferase [Bacteroidota bacterium]